MKAWLDERFGDSHFSYQDFLDDVNTALVFNEITVEEASLIMYYEIMESMII